MDVSYPAKYRDKHGEVDTVIRNDGQTLSMVIRGVEFSGQAFDLFEPTDWSDSSRLASFTFQKASTVDKSGNSTGPQDAWLTGFTNNTEMPIVVVVGDRVENGTLLVHLDRIHPRPDSGREDVLSMVLCIGEARYES